PRDSNLGPAHNTDCESGRGMLGVELGRRLAYKSSFVVELIAQADIEDPGIVCVLQVSLSRQRRSESGVTWFMGSRRCSPSYLDGEPTKTSDQLGVQCGHFDSPWRPGNSSRHRWSLDRQCRLRTTSRTLPLKRWTVNSRSRQCGRDLGRARHGGS